MSDLSGTNFWSKNWQKSIQKRDPFSLVQFRFFISWSLWKSPWIFYSVVGPWRADLVQDGMMDACSISSFSIREWVNSRRGCVGTGTFPGKLGRPTTPFLKLRTKFPPRPHRKVPTQKFLRIYICLTFLLFFAKIEVSFLVGWMVLSLLYIDGSLLQLFLHRPYAGRCLNGHTFWHSVQHGPSGPWSMLLNHGPQID